MTSHFDTTMSVNKHNTTEFGQIVLMDRDTADQWWHLRECSDDASAVGRGRIHALVAGIDEFAPANWVHEDDSFTGSLREPDLYDEGKAFWLTPEAVVSIDIDRLDMIEVILATAERIHWHEDRLGWTRIHPSHYGVDVDSIEGIAHSAHEAWAYITTAIKEA